MWKIYISYTLHVEHQNCENQGYDGILFVYNKCKMGKINKFNQVFIWIKNIQYVCPNMYYIPRPNARQSDYTLPLKVDPPIW